MMMRRAVLCGFAALLLAWPCRGQGDRGLITGLVTDPSGAVIPGTAVRAVNVATNVAARAETNAQGNYTLDFLLPGQYTVTVEKQGFKRFERAGVGVRVNDRMSLDIVLEVGQVSERVVVEAGAPLLETASSSLGTVIDNRRISDLPLVHGNPFMLELLTPGVTFSGNVAWTRPFDSAAAETSVNGSQRQSIEFQLDGVADTWRRVSAYTPSVEFIQEYKVETASYDASQGHSSGAWVNVSLKAGTNLLHGSFYHFLQNRALNSNLFFNNKAGLPRPASTFNRWGGTAGGPLRKDRTFWFFGYEGIRHNVLEDVRALTIPTVPTRTGDLSSLLALGAQYQLYDPFTTRDLGTGRLSRQPLPGNVIPSSRISSIGAKIVDHYPPPNQPGSADGGANYFYGKAEPDRYYSISSRADHALTDRQRIFGRVVASKRLQGPYRHYFPKASGNNLYYKNRGGALDYVYAVNPQTVINARGGYTRFISIHDLETRGFDPASLGLPKWITEGIAPMALVFPRISPSGYQGLNTENPDGNFSDIHSLFGSVSRTQGRHSLRAGADFRVYLANVFSLGGRAGRYTFGGYFNGPFDNSPSAPRGTGLAGLLMGVVDGGGVDLNDSYAARTRYFGTFLHDDWKLTRRLTVNLGLRYEYEGPVVERYNRSVRGFDFAVASPIEAAALANYARSPILEVPVSQFKAKGGLTYAGAGGQPRGLWEAPGHNFAPRIGLAFSLNPKTVLRAGYGVFFDQLGITTRTPIQTGYSQTTSIIPTLDNGVTYQATLANPVPEGRLQQPAGNRDGIATFLGRGISFFNSRPRTPYNQRWSAGFQRQLISDFVADINYVGSRGTAMLVSRELDGTPVAFLSRSPVRDQPTIDRLSTQVPNPFYPLLPGTGLSSSRVSVSTLLRPYPHFTGISMQTNDGYSWYHSLQTRIEKRFSRGYTVMGSWTWSKNMEAISFLNAMDPAPERRVSPNDRTHRVVVNGIYELPFGRGRRFASRLGGPAGKLLEGWQLEGIFQRQSGEPLGLGNFIYYGDARNIVLPASRRTIQRWFNTEGFERDSRRQLASNVRTQPSVFSGLRSDPINYLDLSAIKKTKLTERFSLDFRAESINALNHPVFEAPDTSPTSSTFGVVTATKALPRTIQFALVVRF